MKRSVLFILVAFLMVFGSIRLLAQEQPAPKKDTVNIDTDAKPEKYYNIEDEESMDKKESGSSKMVIIGAGAVVVIGGAALMLLRKKNK